MISPRFRELISYHLSLWFNTFTETEFQLAFFSKQFSRKERPRRDYTINATSTKRKQHTLHPCPFATGKVPLKTDGLPAVARCKFCLRKRNAPPPQHPSLANPLIATINNALLGLKKKQTSDIVAPFALFRKPPTPPNLKFFARIDQVQFTKNTFSRKYFLAIKLKHTYLRLVTLQFT